MTDVKMPEPAVRQERWNYNHWGEIVNQAPDLTAFTEAQMKQYGDDRAREALEMAAVAAWSFHMNRSKRAGLSPTAYEAWSPVSTIRALAKEQEHE